jgi:hypothetical protein
MLRRCALFPILAVVACGSPSPGDRSRVSTAALSSMDTGDAADTGCQVVLRSAAVNLEGRLGPQTDCSSGTCWAMIWVTFDLAMARSLAENEAFVLYQGEGSSTWQQSRQAEPIFGAPQGFRRYQVILESGTFEAGPGNPSVSLIPYLQVSGVGRLFDHNRIADPLGAYSLTPSDDWSVGDDPQACAGAVPASTLALGFATGWQDSASGSLAPLGKIDVSYDIERLPQTLGCSTEGVPAFATMGYVLFQPGGQLLSERVNGPFDSTTNSYTSVPLEFDVPAGTRSASLWFESTSDCGGAYWDSDFGRNYDFSAL